jgi:predicted Fe-Mo cluster-binding NifX family protein
VKIAITSTGETVDSPLDSRFGRTQKFLIYDTEAKSLLVVDNAQNLNAAQGAGIQAAQTVAQTGAQALITGHTGPKAFKVLKTAGIVIYHSSAQTVKDALDALEKGLLQPADDADVDSHWT